MERGFAEAGRADGGEMTRDEWTQFDKISHEANVQFAMQARCDEQGHEWENRCSALFQVYQACKWCGERI